VSLAHVLVLWAHLLAAISWIGGMVFLSLVLAPAYRSASRTPDATGLFRVSAKRFRAVVWTAIAVLLLTGPLLVIDRGWALFEPTRWPSLLVLKIFLVAMLVLTVALHDVFLGPRTKRVLEILSDRRTASDRAVLASATWLPRLAVMLALAVVLVGVLLARS